MRSIITVADYSDPMTLRMFGVSATVAASLASAAQAPAPSIATILDTLDGVRAFHETAISPDGRRVAWVEDVSVADGTTAIYLRAIASPATESHSVTASNDGRGHREDGIAWAPDGHTLAFLSDNGSPGQQQVYVIDVDGNAPARRV